MVDLHVFKKKNQTTRPEVSRSYAVTVKVQDHIFVSY